MTKKDDLEFTSNIQLTLFLMLIAYAFSFAIRLIWVSQFSDQMAFYWNDQLMINTNDGYLWASSALNEINHQFDNNPRIMDMYQYGTVFVTYLAAKILPFSIESIILYMPSVISSLVVVPIILIGRLYNQTLLGFLSALLGSIAWSYYNRTMTGYYDTDMFSAMAPMVILYFLLRSIEIEDLKNLMYAALALMIYPFLYDAGLSIVYAMGVIYMAYMLVFHRRNLITYQSISILSIALIPFFWPLKLILLTVLYLIFKRDILDYKKMQLISIISFILFLVGGNVIALVWAKFAVYFYRGVESEGLKFYQVAQTVREAGTIPFDVMANRISGSTLGVLAALVGYVLLVMKHRGFILALPLIGIGIFSLFGGLRFTVYAVPVAAISAIYLFIYLATFIKQKSLKLVFVFAMTAAMIYPNITHIIGYKVPTVFNKNEVQILDNLKNVGSNKDYIVTWWDYGYPLWFYTNKNTLIDGGKHNHDNFIASEILSTTSQLEAAQLSRIAVETYIKSDYKIVADTLFKNKKEDQINVENYLESLRYSKVELPKKTVEAYLYLPARMLNIFPTVNVFSNINLSTGKKKQNNFFYTTSQFKDAGSSIMLGRGLALDKKSGSIRMGAQNIKVERFVTTAYDKSGKLSVQEQRLHNNGTFIVVYMRSYNKFLVMDKAMYYSTFIQMFVLEKYDHALFEAVELTPLAKIYRVKI